MLLINFIYSFIHLFFVSQLVRQEEELREEEEAYYEAKREAAQAAKLQRQKELANKSSVTTALVPKNGAGGNRGWVGEDDSDWEV